MADADEGQMIVELVAVFRSGAVVDDDPRAFLWVLASQVGDAVLGHQHLDRVSL